MNWRLAAFLASVAPALGAAALALTPVPALERLRDLVFDEYQSLSPRPWSPDLPVRIVAVDEASLAKLGQWPWPRNLHAELTRRLTALGAKAVVWDIIFAEPDRSSPERVLAALPDSPERNALMARLADAKGHDSIFAEAIAEAPIVLAAAVSDGGGTRPPAARAEIAHVRADPRLLAPALDRLVLPLPDLTAAAKGIGASNFTHERDLVMRTLPLVAVFAPDGRRDGAPLVPSLAAEALRVAQGAAAIELHASPDTGIAWLGDGFGSARIGDLDIATERNGAVRIRYAGAQPGRALPAWKVLAGEATREDIAGRIVLVGTTAAGLSDLRSTPLAAATAGVEVEAEMLEHVLSGARLARPDYAPPLEALLALGGALLASWLAMRLRPLPATLSALLLMAASAGGSFLLYREGGLLIDAVLPSSAMALAYVGVTVAVYRRSDRERRSVRDAFSRYLAPTLVARIARDPSRITLGGELREVTILFCDVRGFTERCSTLDARGVVDFLNRLHTPLTAIVLEEGGTIDKYLGDGMMAFWNAPLDTPDHAARACRAALRMQAAIPAIDAALRAEAEAQGRPHMPLAIGIGVNTGEVFVGNMGSEQRFDYSIVGDAVNVAARLESATKDLRIDIAAAAETAHKADGLTFERMGAVTLRGKQDAVEVFALRRLK